jgi:hypothetical protein
MKTDQIGADNASSYPNPFFIGFGADQILYGIRCEYGFFRMSEMIQIWTGDGAEADFFKSDNICLHVVFYDDKQFINQSHKAGIQHKIITINPPLRSKSSQN